MLMNKEGTTLKELDVIRLKDGRIGTVLESFDHGGAFLVEITDQKGKTLDELIVKADEISETVFVS